MSIYVWRCRDYLDRVAEEINQTLQGSGQLSVVELSKSFGLPAEFLLSVRKHFIGVTILLFKGQ